MIIESAFMKIPEVLNFYGEEEYIYESNITNLFSNALVLELNARNIDNPLNKILFEKRYNPLVNRRCDIYTNFDFLNDNLYKYGYYKENFVEVKYFGNLNNKKGTQTKTENSGSLILDIYRLIKGTDNVDKGRYLLSVFDDEPSKFLAFTRSDGSRRNWLDKLFKPGEEKLEFDLSREPTTIKKLFEPYYLDTEDLNINCNIRVTKFAPINNNQGYYGTLIQII